MKKVKRKVNRKRIIIVVLIPLICIALLIANFTSIRLSIKGYHKEDKKVVLKSRFRQLYNATMSANL